MATSLDSLCRKATATCLDSWSTMFQNKKYRGHNFLLLQNLDGGIVQLTYAKGGSWLGEVGGRLSVTTRMCRSILRHAPIGSYFQRFNIDKSHRCECGVPLQTRDHIFVACVTIFHFLYRLYIPLPRDPTTCAAAFTFSLSLLYF